MCCLLGILRESGCTVSPTEVQVPAWRGRLGEASRLEIAYVAHGVRHHADVTVRHPRAQRYVADAARQDGYAAHIGEIDKLERYPAHPGAGLDAVEPVAVETFGRLGPLAVLLLRAARQRLEARTGPASFWLAGALHARWLAQFSVALQAGLFDAVSACAGAVGVPVAAGEGECDGAPLAWAVAPFV